MIRKIDAKIALEGKIPENSIPARLIISEYPVRFLRGLVLDFMPAKSINVSPPFQVMSRDYQLSL